MVYCYYNTFGRRVCRNDRWNSWGRWVLLGVILAAALLFFLLFACISSRRRRRQGHKPFMGTGWAAPGGATYGTSKPAANSGYNNNQTYYNSNEQGYNQGYNQSYNQQGGNQGYYGTQNQPNAYGANNQTYNPPAYPPPAASRP